LPRFSFLAGVLLTVAAAASSADAAFPLELRDDRGTPVRLMAPPRRVVSLAPSLTEIVFLLGREKTLVGVTRYCNHPPEASRLPKIGGVADPDVERIVAASPDLVLCTTDGNPREKVKVLEELGIPCFAVAPQNLREIYASIERIGTLLDVPERAAREVNALRVRAANAARKKSGPAPAVLFAVSTSPIIAAGRDTFMDELLLLSGGKNVAASFSGRYPRLSVEDLVVLRPDVIFVAAMEGVGRFPAEIARWKEVPAFREKAVYSLDGDVVTRPGPRMIAAFEEVSRILSAWRERHAPGSGWKGTR
jgi:iron complex transport system substrate-binding protein